MTFINEIAFHSGHCEAELFGSTGFGRRPKITGFPMPDDLQKKYRGR